MLTVDEQLMIKYIQGECSSAEETMFLQWLHQSDENRKLFYQTKALWNHRSVRHFEADEQISKAVADLNRNIDAIESRRKKKKLYIRFAKYAAILTLALALPIFLYITQQHVNTNAGFITIAVTKTDSSKLITLSDGSRIWLNNNSSLTYPVKFAKGARLVTFSGEAYLEIKHDSLHPFILQTPTMQVKVLGTSFNVRAYPLERKTETILVKGKVIVQNKKGENMAMLAPGQMAEFDKTNGYLSVKEVSPEAYTSWRFGLIVFTNATLNEITNKLSGLYQVDFEYDASKVGATTCNFNFRKSQPINKVMEMLCFIAPLKYQIHEKKITITEDQ